ncbi:MAG: hypothetical protein QM652_00895 [Legionella sp.]|uniref:RCC1 domain-containing protein n=1 Tax=Legionella sp. TaxID=459 RepID=UPI0039E70664
MATCNFFYHNENIQKHRGEIPKYKIDSGTFHTVILTDKNELLVCGINWTGALGIREEKDHSSIKPQLKCINVSISHILHKSEYIKRIAAGNKHTIVLTSKNRILTCGENEMGQLGIATQSKSKFRKDCFFKFTDVFLPLHEREEIEQIGAGDSHTVLLTSKNRVLMSGVNNYNRFGFDLKASQNKFIESPLPILYEEEKILQLFVGKCSTMLVTSNNRLLVNGMNNHGQLGLGHTNFQLEFTESSLSVLFEKEKIQQIAAARDQTVLLTSKNRVLVSGYNNDGRLGLGNTNDQTKFSEVLLSDILSVGEKVEQIATGEDYIILLTKKRVLMCGRNEFGQLGLGYKKKQVTFTPSSLKTSYHEPIKQEQLSTITTCLLM